MGKEREARTLPTVSRWKFERVPVHSTEKNTTVNQKDFEHSSDSKPGTTTENYL